MRYQIGSRHLLRDFLLTVLLILVLQISGCVESQQDGGGKEFQVDKKPNIVLFFIDDLGEKDIYNNNFIDTPFIDQLAREGMKWTNAYASAPVCSPTRAALLTGKNPARVNFTGHITAILRHRHPDNSRIIPPRDLMMIPKEEVILPEALAPAGYKSASIGKWHVGGKGYWPEDMGFDENIGGWTHGSPPSYFYPYTDPDQSWNPSIPTLEGGKEGEYLTDRLTNEAISFIRDNQDRPFFVYLSHYAVHTPLEAPDSLVKKYKKRKTKGGGSRIDPTYAAMVESVDRNIGRVIETLSSLNLSENTIIILASDNGADRAVTDLMPYRKGKGHLYEGGLRVPFIMKWPGVIEPGSRSNRPTKTEDIYATITDIVGNEASPGEPLDGRSLVKDFLGQGSKPPETNDVEMVWYYPHYPPQGSNPGAAIISGDYKLIDFYDPEKSELFNLKTDPGETTNLADTMESKVLELRGKLRNKLHNMDPIMHHYNPHYKP